MKFLVDRRTRVGCLWNIQELVSQHRLGPGARRWNLDRLIYEGFCQAGPTFLDRVEGRFAVAYLDRERELLFLARDWIGEVPFHWSVSNEKIVVANTIEAIQSELKGEYAYRYVLAFPLSKYSLIDVSEIRPHNVANNIRFTEEERYYNFEAECMGKKGGGQKPLRESARCVRELLKQSIQRRLDGNGSRRANLLLSGGLDSFSIAIALRRLGVSVTAYTLSIGAGGKDVSRAREYAKLLGCEHEVVEVDSRQVRNVIDAAIRTSESYHCYNVYCAVGMHLLGERLAAVGVESAFCGEAVNEALGDYRDWEVLDPKSRVSCVLQHVDYRRMERVNERVLYVWGQRGDRGKYNRQLGGGLAKHAGSRMYKPFLHHGIDLESPYYDRSLLSEMIAIRPSALRSHGGKAGFFTMVFKQDLEEMGIPESVLVGSEKVRLQDGSNGGEGGITPILLAHGWTQAKLIRRFNDEFGADLDPEREAARLQGLDPCGTPK